MTRWSQSPTGRSTRSSRISRSRTTERRARERSRRRALRVVAIASLTAFAARASESSERWAVFSPPDGRFAVELPGAPALERNARLTPVGYVYQTKYWLRVGDALLAVELHDIPRIAVALISDDTIVDSARESLIETERGTLLGARALVLRGAPAREFTYQLPGDAQLVERVLAVLVGARLYVITGMAARAPASHPAVARLFASFRFWDEGESDPGAAR